jgi:hypothetical protein
VTNEAHTNRACSCSRGILGRSRRLLPREVNDLTGLLLVLRLGFCLGLSLGKVNQHPRERSQVPFFTPDPADADSTLTVMKRSTHKWTSFQPPAEHAASLRLRNWCLPH